MSLVSSTVRSHSSIFFRSETQVTWTRAQQTDYESLSNSADQGSTNLHVLPLFLVLSCRTRSWIFHKPIHCSSRYSMRIQTGDSKSRRHYPVRWYTPGELSRGLDDAENSWEPVLHVPPDIPVTSDGELRRLSLSTVENKGLETRYGIHLSGDTPYRL